MSPALAMSITAEGGPVDRAEDAVVATAARGARKVKRKASAYNRRFADAYKKLKKKHPRTKHATLMKRAHAQARRGGKR